MSGGMPLQSDSRGLALEGAMALYNLKHFELVSTLAINSVLMLLTCPSATDVSITPLLHESVHNAASGGMCSRLSTTSFSLHWRCLQLWERNLDTKALMAWNDDTVVLSFRGTASFRNVLADLKVMQHELSCATQA